MIPNNNILSSCMRMAARRIAYLLSTFDPFKPRDSNSVGVVSIIMSIQDGRADNTQARVEFVLASNISDNDYVLLMLEKAIDAVEESSKQQTENVGKPN